MNEELPPPNWSPSGNSGYWIWDAEWKERINRTQRTNGAWRWYDDVYGYEWKKGLEQEKRPKPIKMTWTQKLKNFFKSK